MSKKYRKYANAVIEHTKQMALMCEETANSFKQRNSVA